MPVMFVHGVNTRKSQPGYAAGIAVIDRFVQKHFAGVALDGKAVVSLAPQFPYWGDLGTSFAWNMASLPSGRVDALGPAVDDGLRPVIAVFEDELADAASARQQPLLTLATRKTLPHAVDVLTDLLMQTAPENQAGIVADFIVAVRGYAEVNPSPAWLGSVTTDEQFLNRLVSETKTVAPAGVQSLGLMDKVLNPLVAAGAKLKAAMTAAATTILDRSGDFASTKLLAWQRRPLNETLGRFFGDVFVYMDSRGDKNAPGAIPKLILDAIDAAKAAAPPNDPLIILGHSLGGVICFDLFSHFRPDLTIDLFVSIGSQVSHFEEMKLFKASDRSIRPPQKAATPANIKHWINIFDVVDIFSYACERVFDRVEDFAYDTQTYVIKAHSAYFAQDRFYARLRARVDAFAVQP